jgi:ribonuclease HI
MNSEIKQEELKSIKMFSDGGSRGNPGPSASGYVLMTLSGEIIKREGIYLGITTNNQAEYKSLKFGLEHAKKIGAREVAVNMDSQLAIRQMNGIYKIKNPGLVPIYKAIKSLEAGFDKVTYNHVPREQNKLADAEVNKCLDLEALR